MEKFPLYCVGLWLSAALSIGGCNSAPPVSASAASTISWNGQDRVELPLTYSEHGQPTVPVRIKGKDVVATPDTGSPRSRFSPEFANAIGLRVDNQGRPQNELVIEYGAVSQTLELITVVKPAAPRDVIAGQELFLQAVVEFDFDRLVVALVRPSAFTPPSDTPLEVQFSRSWPTIKIKVNDHDEPICAIVDTGYGGGVALAQKAVDELALPIIPGVRARLITEWGIAEDVPQMKELQELRVGDQLYRNVHLAISPVRDGNQCTAILGVDILSRHRVIFDLGNRRMWLLHRSSGVSPR